MMFLRFQGRSSIVFQISIMMSKAQIDLRHSSLFRVKFLPNYKETQNQNCYNFLRFSVICN